MSISSLKLPEVFEQDYDRFLVHDRLEIVSILRKLQTRRDQVTLNWDPSGFALSMVLAINPEYEEMVLDCGSDPDANKALLKTDRITLVAMVEGVKVQCSGRHADATVFEGYPALRMRLPDLLLRLQRRDYFRVRSNLSSQIALENDGSVRVLEWRVADMSLGGVALVADKEIARLETGRVLENCRIALGPLGTLSLTLQVQNTSETIMRNGARQYRIGCQFVDLSSSIERLISNFINKAERERLSRD